MPGLDRPRSSMRYMADAVYALGLGLIEDKVNIRGLSPGIPVKKTF